MHSKMFAARTVLFFILATLTITIFQNCSPVNFRTHLLESESTTDNGNGGNAGFNAGGVSLNLCTTNPNAPECTNGSACMFNGKRYPEGSVIQAYLNSTATGTQSCQAQERRCVAGAFSGSYQYPTCALNAKAACLFNGQTIPHGGTVRAYTSSTVPFGSTCQSVAVTRECNDGTLTGNAAFANCQPSSAASCIFNGLTIPSGGVTTAYLSATVPYGQSCVSQVRSCSNGSLAGSYAYSNCSQTLAASCNFNGQIISHGSSVKAYATSGVPYGQSCVSQDRVCMNGSLGGVYAYSDCAVAAAPKTCNFNGQTIAHGQSVKAYASAGVPYGQSCAVQSRTCDNGNLSGSYLYGSCEMGAAAACWFSGGYQGWGAYGCSNSVAAETIPHGQSRTIASTSATGSGSITYSCSNGVLSQSNNCEQRRCGPMNSAPKCTIITYCANGRILHALNNQNPGAYFAISGAVGETINTSASQITPHDSRLRITRWDNLQLRCESSLGWRQLNDGFCVMTQTVPNESNGLCTEIYDSGGG